jgi:hypothetical protein
VGVLLFSVGFLISRETDLVSLGPSSTARAVDVGAEKTEWVLVYIGSSTCGPSNKPELPALVARARSALQARARLMDRRVWLVGIAQDESAETGLAHLRKIEAFDEVLAGHGWLNTGLTRYVFGDLPGMPATPQLILTERTISRGGTAMPVANERSIIRTVGLSEITRWSEPGFVEHLLPSTH